MRLEVFRELVQETQGTQQRKSTSLVLALLVVNAVKFRKIIEGKVFIAVVGC